MVIMRIFLNCQKSKFKMNKIGLFFGSFDPIHIGHMNVINSVLNMDLVSNVQLVVAYSNPWKPRQTPFEDRCSMARLATHTTPYVTVNTIEKDVYEKWGITCTYKVIEALKEKFSKSNSELYIITTQETYSEIPNWKNGEEIIKNNKFIIIFSDHFGTVNFEPKDGDILIDIKDIPISSTNIRDMVACNQMLVPFTDKHVELYIKNHKLYKE